MSFICFSRKKDKRKSLEQTSLSAGSSPLRLAQHSQRPVSQNLDIPPRTSAYDGAKSPVVKEWQCGICRKELVEPRLLGCLHSFCTQCLQGLHREGDAEAWSEIDGGSRFEAGESRTVSNGGSAGSGYESDPHHSGSEESWGKPHKYGIFTRKISGKSVHFLLCPTCGDETPLPLGGIAALPLNYVLLRKMVTDRSADNASVLCDLCTTDTKAESRCDQCLVSVCALCRETHGRQKATSRHSLRPLDPLPAKYCSQHPRAELSVYCATCHQVICRDCCIVSHAGHAMASAARAAEERARCLRAALERARLVPDHVQRALDVLHADAYRADSQAAAVEIEISQWSERYVRAVSAHARALQAAAARARHAQRRRHDAHARALQRRAAHATDACAFADEVLAEAKEDEILSLGSAVCRRLEILTEVSAPARESCPLRFSADAPAPHDPTLVGRLLTRAPDPDRCVLYTEGLQDLIVDCPHEAILELRDSNGDMIWCGDEQVCGYFRRRECRQAPAVSRVRRRADGRYALRLRAPAPGPYLLAVTLDNRPIQGSPFACSARTATHTGQFHCCAFCSSGGKRDAVCGCGAVMPGYKGCGHGHAGWPGARHWSCCGSARKHGICTRDARPNTQQYQFSL